MTTTVWSIEVIGTAGVALVWGWLLAMPLGVSPWRTTVLRTATTLAVWYLAHLLSGGGELPAFAVGTAVSLIVHLLWRDHLAMNAVRQGG